MNSPEPTPFDYLQRQALLSLAHTNPSSFIDLVEAGVKENRLSKDCILFVTDEKVLEDASVRLFASEWRRLNYSREQIPPNPVAKNNKTGAMINSVGPIEIESNCTICFSDEENSDVEQSDSLSTIDSESEASTPSIEMTPDPMYLPYVRSKMNSLRRVRQTLSIDFDFSDAEDFYSGYDTQNEDATPIEMILDDPIPHEGLRDLPKEGVFEGATTSFPSQLQGLHDEEKGNRRDSLQFFQQVSPRALRQLQNIQSLVQNSEYNSLDLYMSIGALSVGGVDLAGMNDFFRHVLGNDHFVDVLEMLQDIIFVAEMYTTTERNLIEKLKNSEVTGTGSGLRSFARLTKVDLSALIFVVGMLGKDKFGGKSSRIQKTLRRLVGMFYSCDETEIRNKADQLMICCRTKRWSPNRFL